MHEARRVRSWKAERRAWMRVWSSVRAVGRGVEEVEEEGGWVMREMNFVMNVEKDGFEEEVVG